MTPPDSSLHLVTQALSLDLAVLEQLLKRHRCSHGRTKYHQRLCQLLPHVRQLLTLPERLYQHQQERLLEEQRQQARLRRQPDAWTKSNEETPLLHQREVDPLTQLDGSWESRLEHASAALWQEVRRGFYLPWMVVALGCVARIRTTGQTVEQACRGGQLSMSSSSSLSLPILQAPRRVCEPQSNATSERLVLTQLGLTPPKPKSNNDVGGEAERKEADGDADDNRRTAPSLHVEQVVDDGDVGESILELASTAASTPTINNNSSKTTREVDAVDQNQLLLESVKKVKDNKPSKKRKDASKEKKKKKKKSKSDFFDNLFS